MSGKFSSGTRASFLSTRNKFIFAALPFGCMPCMGELGTQITYSCEISQPLKNVTRQNTGKFITLKFQDIS